MLHPAVWLKNLFAYIRTLKPSVAAAAVAEAAAIAAAVAVAMAAAAAIAAAEACLQQ